MNASRNFALPLVALFFGLLLVPRAAMAGAADCPSEPKQGVPILSGDVYAGTNCTLNTPGDIDGFQFAANSGDVWEAVVGINGVVDNNICLTIYDPNGNTVFSGCSSYGLNSFAVLTQQSLTTTGKYSLAVTEEYEGALNYGASLERLYPAPPDGKMVTLGQAVDAEINPVSDQGTYTFVGSSNSKYQASATVLDSDTQNVCLAVFSPTGTSEGSGCTNYGLNSFTVNVQFTPPESGTNVVIVTQGANNSTVNYSVEVSCLSNCTVKTSALYPKRRR
jgi:hypothetical protein